jgi:hypothetical protein
MGCRAPDAPTVGPLSSRIDGDDFADCSQINKEH